MIPVYWTMLWKFEYQYPGFQEATIFENEAQDDPPLVQASTAIAFRARLLSRRPFPSSDSESINSLTLFSNSPALTNSSLVEDDDTFSIGVASFISSTKTILFMRCSAYNGHAAIGTPQVTASSTEFHPQCVTNPPTESWLRMADCGAHDFTTIPLSLVLSRNPSGSSTSKSGSVLGFSGPFTTHKNLWLLFSNPMAISFSCNSENEPLLPKHKNTTLRCGCESNHAKQSKDTSLKPTALSLA
ncbi:hypothetical protein PanWU01x14_335120 [Parasponia andersonii]|uniref:Uncharacterized protein n=1 Tax=Parasponia andersonii TaxID=3476 RepID=A0A2P5AGE7_PARAD|nr:hypothetical protein PanWU01x14_335120 [Parasponia andersonii]